MRFNTIGAGLVHLTPQCFEGAALAARNHPIPPNDYHSEMDFENATRRLIVMRLAELDRLIQFGSKPRIPSRASAAFILLSARENA